LAPPLLCAGWYALWRRRYPDAVRLAQQRRSRAAQLALRAIGGARRLPGRQGDEVVVAAVADYLRQRFDLPAAEPTPIEAAQALREQGATPDLIAQGEGFFRAGDEARFRPPGRPAAKLAERATRFILAVEARPWEPPC
jgi:hypothetical protein